MAVATKLCVGRQAEGVPEAQFAMGGGGGGGGGGVWGMLPITHKFKSPEMPFPEAN